MIEADRMTHNFNDRKYHLSKYILMTKPLLMTRIQHVPCSSYPPAGVELAVTGMRGTQRCRQRRDVAGGQKNTKRAPPLSPNGSGHWALEGCTGIYAYHEPMLNAFSYPLPTALL